MLTLAGCSKLTDEAIHYIAEYCTKLEELDLSGCTNIGYDAMLAIREIGKGQTLRVSSLAACVAQLQLYCVHACMLYALQLQCAERGNQHGPQVGSVNLAGRRQQVN